ncbi:MAG TPA: prephenate dehydratase domain-containing protein, partial [Candidatus Limnocylindria bacterium]|nr:prephenate dehydratase domain-containing protein [Candidatus Limnocylindria bacterium]
MTVAYQGLAGAFSEAAAAALFRDEALLACRTFAEVFSALERAEVDAAVVPVENTHAGSVADVYDLLRTHRTAIIVAETIVRVRHCLLGVPGTTLDAVKIARSHPQALAQTEDFLRTHQIQPEVAFDTAGAAMEVARIKDPTVAAVASRRAAARYGLVVLADGIETSDDNFTRFFALARRGDDAVTRRVDPAQLAGPAKTSLVYTTKNQPGALTRSLQPFATAGLQLTKIESRPSRAAPWQYV